MLQRVSAQVHPGAKPYLGRFGFMNTLTRSRVVSATAVRARSRAKKIFPSTGAHLPDPRSSECPNRLPGIPAPTSGSSGNRASRSMRSRREARASAGRPSLRPLQLSFAVIADHGIEQLEEILDSHRVTGRMAEAGSEPVAISDDGLD